MRSLVLALISSLIVSAASAAASGPCGHEVFLSKVCVSGQTLPLQGDEMARLQCEDPARHPSIYSTLEEAFLMAPPWFQHRLCGLERLGVYNPQPASVLSWSYFSEASYIGISKSRMDQIYDLKSHAASMMKHAKKNKTIPEGVVFPENFGYQAPLKDTGAGILYLLAHEVGHIVYNPHDDVTRKGSFHSCKVIWDSIVCDDFTQNQYGFIDWVTGSGELGSTLRGKTRTENENLRSYILADAKVEHTPEKADAFFRSLNNSSFVSPFSLFSPEEDFCETFAHIVMAESAKPFEFHYLSGEKINVWDRVRHPKDKKLKDKIDFINKLIKE